VIRNICAVLGAVTALLTIPAAAQPQVYGGKAPLFRHEIRLNGLSFGNFYQATQPGLSESVQAAQVEYRAAYRPAGRLTDLYGQANYTWWNKSSLPGSYSGRIGLNRRTNAQIYNVFVNYASNRPSFEVANTYSKASTVLTHADIAQLVHPKWRIGLQADYERQTHDGSSLRDNDYFGAGASAQYLGFGPKIVPRVGFIDGRRNVPRLPNESYRNTDYFAELSTDAYWPFWGSIAYHTRGKGYSVNDPIAPNFHRDETGPSWEVYLSYRSHPRITWSLYGSYDTVNSSAPNADFSTNLLLVGVSYRL
jgi:hypothetical protein